MIIKDWGKKELSIVLVYPNTSEIGLSSYAMRLLYSLINSKPNMVCERFFLPKYVKYPASNDPLPNDSLRSIESAVLIKDFDIIGFSIHSENDFRNVLWILEKIGIPLTSKTREKQRISENYNYPLLIAGGPVVTSNPLPFADCFDLIFIGDSEPNLFSVLQLYLEEKKSTILSNFLEKVANIEGIFVPEHDNSVKRAILRDLNSISIPSYQVISKSTEKKIFESYFFVEINRGCPYQCKFCLSSFHNSPFRNRNLENIKSTIEKTFNRPEIETIALIGSCVSSHPHFLNICDYIVKNGKKIAIPSIRIEHINKNILQILGSGGVKTITIAPEAGNERLRFNLGKMISNDKILSAVRIIRNSTIRSIKFYFLIGLPGESIEDVREIAFLLKNIAQLNFSKNALKVHVNPFVPKLNTPFQNEISHFLEKNIKNLNQKYKILEQELKQQAKFKFNFVDYKNTIKNAKLQALISTADREISKLLMVYYQNGANFGALRRAERQLEMSIDNYFDKISSGYVPWSF
ncbi:MAG: radical SAM protein [Candidatus Lokiarchaeota archaeon]|nr:radical SAM protein [Candidatus Lokiarchaeota archaeon]